MKGAKTSQSSVNALGDILGAEGPERQAKLDEASKTLREELEQLSGKIVALVLLQSPTGLLG